MTGADSWSKNTMKNTIDDADYIINWSFFIIVFQCVTNPATPTLLSISLYYLLFSMTYFTQNRQYHEKYHAQKFLENKFILRPISGLKANPS